MGCRCEGGGQAVRAEKGVPNLDDAGLTGYRPLSLRAYRLTNNEVAGMTVRQFLQKYIRSTKSSTSDAATRT